MSEFWFPNLGDVEKGIWRKYLYRLPALAISNTSEFDNSRFICVKISSFEGEMEKGADRYFAKGEYAIVWLPIDLGEDGKIEMINNFANES